MSESHYAEHQERLVTEYVEVWCPEIDEVVEIKLGMEYVSNCPMCGGAIEVHEE